MSLVGVQPQHRRLGGELAPGRLAGCHLNHRACHRPDISLAPCPRLLDDLRCHPVGRPLDVLAPRICNSRRHVNVCKSLWPSAQQMADWTATAVLTGSRNTAAQSRRSVRDGPNIRGCSKNMTQTSFEAPGASNAPGTGVLTVLHRAAAHESHHLQ